MRLWTFLAIFGNSVVRWMNLACHGRSDIVLRSVFCPGTKRLHCKRSLRKRSCATPKFPCLTIWHALIATLLNGRLEGHGFNIYQSNWLAKLQDAFGGWAVHECFKDHRIGLIRPKYRIKNTRARQRYRDLLFTFMRTLSQVGAEHGLQR
jgi:hypothetical protein